jgi:hypothetical protein
MCFGASEGASGSSALRRASSPHGPSAPLASGPVTYVRFVMGNYAFDYLSSSDLSSFGKYGKVNLLFQSNSNEVHRNDQVRFSAPSYDSS